MGKQAGLLKHITQRALVHRHEQASRVVLPHLTVDLEVAARRTLQAGHAPQQGRFARARTAENSGHAAPRQVECNIKRKIAELALKSRMDSVHKAGPLFARPLFARPLCLRAAGCSV